MSSNGYPLEGPDPSRNPRTHRDGYRAKLTDAGATVGFGFGRTAWQARMDLASRLTALHGGKKGVALPAMIAAVLPEEDAPDA